ncbi:MAG: tetratricopeptide repeat protein [Burkholderiaceae bacterium]
MTKAVTAVAQPLQRIAGAVRVCVVACLLAIMPSMVQANDSDLASLERVPDIGHKLERGIGLPLYAAGKVEGIESFSPLARLIGEANRMIRARQFRPAYRLLSPETDLYAGDTEFDYLLGIAALESGRPGEAVLALERVLINQPNRLRARAELARAYLALQERDNARREFESVAAQQIPAEAREVIARYLDALSRVKNQPDPVISATVSIGIGYDNNVNIGSSAETWLLADGTAVTPLPPSQPQKTAFASLSGGIKATVPINGRLQWITGINGMLRNHPSAHTLDQEQVDVSTGFVYRNKCHQVKMLGQAQLLSVDQDAFRNAAGLVGQWQCDLNAQQQLGGFAQRFELRFPDQDQLDAARQSLGVSYARLLPVVKDAILLGTVQTGREYSKTGLANLSYDFTGIRVMLIAPISAELSGSFGLNYEIRRFDGDEPLFGVRRDDHQTEVRLGLQREIAEHWTLEPQLVLTRNRSTLAPSDFSRTQAQLVARYRLN